MNRPATTPPADADPEGGSHEPRHQLGLSPEHGSGPMHALAVALLLNMSPDELFDALREVFAEHSAEPLYASTGARVSPCPAPVEAPNAASPGR